MILQRETHTPDEDRKARERHPDTIITIIDSAHLADWRIEIACATFAAAFIGGTTLLAWLAMS